MTIDYPFSLAQLAQILSALENERRKVRRRRARVQNRRLTARIVDIPPDQKKAP